jgi:serine phosphatase RsbU (regulator of sigma subunit)
MMEELGLASELQKSLLPKEFPSDLPLELCRKYMPLATVGGDFFDVSMVDPTHVGIIIADVSGHGVAPAFITAMLKSAYSHISPGELSPAEVMGRLNQEFARNLRTEHYLTGFYTIVDVESLECLYCNAGHPKQLLIRAGGGEEELETQGFFLGMFDGTTYEDGRVSLNPGDALCFFTDGIIEAKDAGGNQFDREGIVKSYRAHELESMEAISNALVQDLLEFTAGPELEDDLTFIAARVIESL